MTLNDGSVTVAEIESFYGAQHKNFNEVGHKLSAAKCTSMILASRNVRCIRIFTGFLGEGVSKDNGVVGDDIFTVIVSETLDRIYRLYIPGGPN